MPLRVQSIFPWLSYPPVFPTYLVFSVASQNMGCDQSALPQAWQFVARHTHFSICKMIYNFFCYAPLRGDWLTRPRAQLYVARQYSCYSISSFTTASEQHSIRNLCIENISSATYSSRILFIPDFGFKTRQVCKTYIEMFTPRLKRRRAIHSAEYALRHHCYANSCVENQVIITNYLLFKTILIFVGTYITYHASRFSGMASAALLPYQEFVSIWNLAPISDPYDATGRSFIIHTPLEKHRHSYSKIHVLRLKHHISALRPLHFSYNKTSLNLYYFSATVHRAWPIDYSNVGHHDPLSTWTFRY